MRLLAITMLSMGCGRAPEASNVALDAATSAPVPDGLQRGWRRMDLEQLDTSIRKVTGGIGWDDTTGNSQFEALADTLGAADFVQGTAEDLTVSLLFLKFLEDAAGNVCTRLVEREKGGAGVFLTQVDAQMTTETDAAGIRATLADGLLRFHGRAVTPDSPQIEPWLFLFESGALVGGDPAEGWRAVCVGLLTHPDFYTY